MNVIRIDRASVKSFARRFTICCVTALTAGAVIGLPPAVHAQSSPDVSQMADTLKRLEARVNALEAENKQSRREATAARAEAQALRQKIGTSKPVAISSHAAPTYTAMAAATSRDLYANAGPIAPVTSGWSGFYAGAAGGVGWMHSNGTIGQDSTSISSSTSTFPGIPPTTFTSTSTATATENISGRSPGEMSSLFLGYNHMLNGSWLIGGQLEGTLANTAVNLNGAGTASSTTSSLTTPPGGSPTTATSTGPISGGAGGLDNRWLVSVLARGGFLVDPTDLVYALGGYTYGRFEVGAIGEGFGMNGGTVGVGWERQIVPGWNLRAEYRYTRFASSTLNFGSSTSTSGTSLTAASTINESFRFSDVDMHSVWLGVSHSFGP
jgi:outer membrane immunogenic protein